MSHFFEEHLLPCGYKSLFGIDCPTCGAQRSMLMLIKGNFIESFYYYPPLIPVLLLIIISITYLFNQNIVKAIFLKNFSLFVLILIAINYVIKIVI